MPPQKDTAYCPECDSRIKLNSPRIGQKIACRACGTELEVIDMSPLELDWAFDSPYDDDEFDDDEFEYDDFEEFEDDEYDDD